MRWMPRVLRSLYVFPALALPSLALAGVPSGGSSRGQPFGRSDYDCSGTLGANDLSLWLSAFGSGAMAESCASQCP